MGKVLKKNKMDKRLVLKTITVCEVCPHFRDDNCGFGNAKYSCAHPSGPGDRLTEEIVRQMKIHEDCPLVKVDDD